LTRQCKVGANRRNANLNVNITVEGMISALDATEQANRGAQTVTINGRPALPHG
jgi:hypothetical protein